MNKLNAVITIITILLVFTLNPAARAEGGSPTVILDSQDPVWQRAMQRGLDPESLRQGRHDGVTSSADGPGRLQPTPLEEFLREYTHRYPVLAVGWPGGRAKRRIHGDRTADLKYDLVWIRGPLRILHGYRPR